MSAVVELLEAGVLAVAEAPSLAGVVEAAPPDDGVVGAPLPVDVDAVATTSLFESSVVETAPVVGVVAAPAPDKAGSIVAGLLVAGPVVGLPPFDAAVGEDPDESWAATEEDTSVATA